MVTMDLLIDVVDMEEIYLFFIYVYGNLSGQINIYFKMNRIASMYIAGDSFLNLPQIMFMRT